MLSTYENAVKNLLQAPAAQVPLVPTAQLDIYINQARGQIAGQGKCIRPDNVTLSLTTGQRLYQFSSIIIASASALGIGGANDVRQVSYRVGQGQKILVSRPIEWFTTYYLSNPVPDTGEPKRWTQRGQGQVGSLLFDPIPDIDYECPLDIEAFPIVLVDDSTPEAIPPLWRDPVPFYSAWLAFQQLQRQADAEAMMKRYTELMNRARQAATPDVLPDNYEQQPDVTLGNKLGVQGRGG